MSNHFQTYRTVLYVEDNEVNALLMQALFKHRPDLRLQVADSCAGALRRVRLHRPDLLLLDLRLPDGHGCDLLPQLRSLPGLQHVPAVAVSAEDLPTFRQHGFDDHWPKPLNLASVLDQLDHWLPERSSRALQPPPAPDRRLAPPSGLALG